MNGLIVQGNVGIGTNNPSGTFTVDGSERIDINTTDSNNGINIGSANPSVPVTLGGGSSITTVGNNLVVNGDLQVMGVTSSVNTSIITVQEPVLTLGGTSNPTVQDNLDRGIKFRYFKDSGKIGFFGYDNSHDRFTFLKKCN